MGQSVVFSPKSLILPAFSSKSRWIYHSNLSNGDNYLLNSRHHFIDSRHNSLCCCHHLSFGDDNLSSGEGFAADSRHQMAFGRHYFSSGDGNLPVCRGHLSFGSLEKTGCFGSIPR
jgi:hypothetical protein